MMNRLFINWNLLLVCLLFAGAQLYGAVRINEVMFDPAIGSNPDEEFIELYNSGPGSVDLLDWSLFMDATLLKKFDASYTLASGEYVSVYVGSPTNPPTNSILIGSLIKLLGDNGGELLLTDDSDTPIDYIAYGSAVANPPSPLVFPVPISLTTYWQVGDSIAFLQPSGTDSDVPTQWLNRRGTNVTSGAQNTEQPEPTLSYGTITTPSDFPTVDSCETIVIPIALDYSDEAPVFNTSVSFTIPDGFFFVSADSGGTFTDSTRTVTWNIGTLFDSQSLELRLCPNCSTTGGEFEDSALGLSYGHFSGQTPLLTANATNSIAAFTVNRPDLSVNMGQYLTGDSIIITDIGLLVKFQIVVTNNGTGNLSGDGGELALTLASNLSLIGFRQDGPSGASIQNLELDTANGIFTGSIGALSAGESRLFYVKALIVGYTDVFDSAKANVSWGCADAAPGSQSCLLTSEDSTSVFSSPIMEFEVPSSEPESYSGGQNVVRNIVISNPNGVAIELQDLSVDLPTGYYWVSSKIGTSDIGTYNQVDKTISFTASELTGGTGTVAANSSVTIELIMRSSCTAANDRKLTADLNYQIVSPENGTYTGSLSEESAGIVLYLPALAVSVEDPNDSTLTTVLAERGEIVTFKVIVVNNGIGDLDTDGKPAGEEGGWLELGTIGTGLSLQSVFDITDGEPGTEVTPTGTDVSWPTGVMASGSEKTYLINFLVVSCKDVAYEIKTYWTSLGTHEDDFCRQDGESKGSVNILLRNPSLTITPTPFVVNYCNGVTMTLPVVNATGESIGAARNVTVNMFGMNLSQYTLSNGVDSDFDVSVADNVATFTLVHGQDTDIDGAEDDIASGGTYNIVVDIAIMDNACNADTGGLLIFQPDYEDSCGIEYTAGTQLSSYTRTDPPLVSFTKSGPAVATVGDTGLTWNMTLTYVGTPGDPLEYTLVDNYPDSVNNAYGNFVITSASPTGYVDDGDKMTWTISDVFNVDGEYTQTFTISFNAPDIVCAGGRTYTNNAVVNISTPVDPVDCHNCPQADSFSASSSITFNNRVEDDIDQHDRKITYQNVNVHSLDNSAYQTAGETCTEMVYDQLMRFTAASPNAWTVDVDPDAQVEDIRPIRFRDDLNQRLRAPGGVKANLGLEIYYFADSWQPGSPSGTNYGPTGSALVDWDDVTYVAPTTGADGYLQVDLSGLNNISGAPENPSEQGILWIRYTLQSQEATVGSFSDFAKLIVPLNGADPCSLGEPETEYYHLVNTTVADPVATVLLTNVSSPDSQHIDRCETLTLRCTLGIEDDTPFDVYDGRLVVDLGTNYKYISDSTVFGSGLKDEGGSAFSSFEPTESGTTLIWNLGDLRDLDGTGGGRYIDIQVQKKCDQTSTLVSATVSSNTQCIQVDDTNGSGAANSQDSAVAALVSFSNSRSSSYQPQLYSGNLETRFASDSVFYNNGYPSALFHIVNSGNGNLYNVRVPIELGSLQNGTDSLTFIEAHVTAISGVTSEVVDLVNPIVPVEQGTEGTHGYREITFGIDWMEPSSIITIRLTMRMVLCTDLSLKIVQSRWGCSADIDSACPADLTVAKLNSSMQIYSGNTNVLVVKHSATPSVIDLCGSITKVKIEILNSGSVDVYEPIVAEHLPEGMTILPNSVKYSINGGALTSFPEVSGTGLRYTELTETSSTEGTYQSISWVFTDPNHDRNEADSLLSGSGFDDPYPSDSYFQRHKVMKRGTRIAIEFDIQLSGCVNALYYKNSEHKAEASIFFDLPCQHDNRYNSDGSLADGGYRLPLDNNTKNSNFLDPGIANVVISLNGQNTTQGGALTFNQVNAELGNNVEWTIQIDSLGPGVVAKPNLEIFVPSNLTVDFATTPPEITTPANIVFVDSNPTGVAESSPDGTRYTFVFQNTDADMIAGDREFYFAADDKVTVMVQSTVNSCTEEKSTLETNIIWGCCKDISGLESASGVDESSTALKTIPDLPKIAITEGDGASITEFNGCRGAYQITITNPSTNSELSLWNVDVQLPLPTGWMYAPPDDEGTDFSYVGDGARLVADQLLAAEEEPVISGSVLHWTSVSRGGNIPDAKAKLFPLEQLVLTVYLRADGTSTNCDLDGAADPPVPNFTQSVSLVNYEDSSGTSLGDPIVASVPIIPEYPNLNISLVPKTRFIDGTTTEVLWELRVQNAGEKTAENITLEITFADGYSAVSNTGGTPSPVQASREFSWASGTIASIDAGEILLWTFTGTIDTVNRGDLSANAVVRGYCIGRDGSIGCTYSFDETEQFVSGGAISKVLDGTRLQAPAVSTAPSANNAAATEADVSIGTILRYLVTVELYEGGDTDIIIRDVLPDGLAFLEANLVDNAGNLVANITPTSTSNNIITFSHSSISQFADISGGSVGTNALFLEIWARVLNNTSVNVEGGTKENTAQLTIIRGTQTFDHTSPDLTLFDSNTITILEPFIRDDGNLTKVSDPVSLPENHVGAVLDIEDRPTGENPIAYTFIAKNTGTSPAYELEFTDLFPWQFEDPTLLEAPYALTVTIIPDTGSPRVLAKNTDYSTSWVAGVNPDPGTLKVQLLSTTDAILGINETITFVYHGKVETFAPGTFLDNSGDITSYSSLPGTGATLVTARSTNLLENVAERTSYGDLYRALSVKQTYHKFTDELIASGSIIAEITPMADDASPDFRNDGTTRAVIGEQIEYWVRLSLPQRITLHDLAFSFDAPDGLTVRSAKWEVVASGADFSTAEKNLSFNELGTGITEVRGVTGVGADDFPDPLSNNTENDQEILVKVLFTVDRTYTGGSAVLLGNAFSVPATFSWSTGTDSTDPIPVFTVVDPELTTLTKERTAHLEADNVTSAVSPGFGTYPNYNLIGPDNATTPTNPVADVYQVSPTDIVEFTVTFRNDGDATAWNIQLQDSIPDGMTLRSGSVSIVTDPVDANITISDPTPANVVVFAINRVLAGAAVTVTYRCDIDADVAVGRYLQNQVELVQYSSLPEAPFSSPVVPEVTWPDADRSVTSGDPDQYSALGPVFENAGTEFPVTAKTVEAEVTAPSGPLKDGTSRASIGERMTYKVRLDIPDTASLYDLTFLDIVPDGLTVQSAVYSINGGASAALDAVVNADGTTTVSATSVPFGDVAGLTGVTDEVVVTIITTVDKAFVSATGATDNGPFGVGAANGIVDAGDTYDNNASFTWNQVNDEVTTNTQDAEQSPVSFTILEPFLETLTKTKSSVTPAAFSGSTDGYRNYNTVGPNPNNTDAVDGVDQVIPGHVVLYTVTFVNNGDTTAYDIDLADEIPEGMSYVPGSATITAGPNASTIIFRSVPTAPVLPSRTLNFEVNVLEPGNTATLTYQLQVDTPVGAGRFLLNQINLVDYRSQPTTAAYPDAARTTDGASANYSPLGPAFTYVGTAFPSMTKTVESELSLPEGKLTDGSARGTIGEVMTYELLIDIPDDTMLYDLFLEDVIPANLTIHSQNLVPADMTYAVVNNNGVTTTYGSAAAQFSMADNKIGFYLETDARAENGVTNEIRVVIAVTVDDVAANVTGTVFENNATLSWNQVDENPGSAAGRAVVNSFVTPDPAATPDSVDFTVIEPAFVNTTLIKTRTGHYLSDGTTAATSPGTASYRNYNSAGPESPVTALDPVPDVYQVQPTDILEYTVTFANSGDARAYDITLTDDVPAGFTLLTTGVNAPTLTGGTTADIAFLNSTPSQAGGSGTPISFHINWLDSGQTCTLTFRTQIEPGIGAGAYLQNKMTMTDFGTTPDIAAIFPDLERDTDSTVPYTDPDPKFEKVGSEYPVTSKTIQTEQTFPEGKLKDGSSRATIGEQITYEILIDIKDDLTLFDLNIADLLPDGLTVKTASYSIHSGASVAMTIAEQGDGTTLVDDTAALLGDVVAVDAQTNEIVLTITAAVDQTFVSATGTTDNGAFGAGGANGIVDAGDIFANNATLTWNQVNDVATASTQQIEPADVTFTILEPLLETLTKTKSAVTPAAFNGPADGYRNYNTVGPNPNNAGAVDSVDQVIPGHVVLYTVTFVNNGDTTAYDIDLADEIPEGMSYVPGSATITAGPNASTIAFRSVPTAPVLPSRTLNFEINVLEPDNTATLTYQLQVDTPVGAGRFLLNQINLVDYRSLPTTAIYPDAARNTEAPSPNYGSLGPAFSYVGTAFPTMTKTVESKRSLPDGKWTDGSARGTIGEVMTYELRIDIPDDTMLYDLLLEDVIPVNLTVHSQNLVPADMTYAVVNNNGVTTTYGSAAAQLSIVANTVGLYLETDARAQNGVSNEILVVIAVTVDDVAANVAGTVFENNATLSWNQVDENPGSAAGRAVVNSFITPDSAATPDSVDFTIIEPAFVTTTLTKTRTGHYLSDGTTAATSPGTASYRNFNSAGPESPVTALDPVPDVYQVRPTEILEYTVTFVNSGDAPAYDITLTDTVPTGFTLLTTGVNAPTLTGGTTADIDFLNSTPAQASSGADISFHINWLDPGQTCTLTFRTQIEPGIGAGAYLQNQITLTDFGTTPELAAVFPDLERDTDLSVPYTDPEPKFEKVGSEYPVTSKTIQTELTSPAGKLKDGSSRATIGEQVTYEILVDVKDDLVLFDLHFSDLVPDGLTIQTATYSIHSGASVAMTVAPQAAGTTLVTDATTALSDVSAVAALTNEVVLTIIGTVDPTFVSGTGATDNGVSGTVDDGDILANNATITWNQVNDDEAVKNTQDVEPATIPFTIVEPDLGDSFAKEIVRILDSDGSSEVTTTRGHSGAVSINIPSAVSGKTSFFRYPSGGGTPTQIDDVQVVLPDDYVEYSITLTNSGTARAFDIDIRDVLPPVAEVLYTSGTGVFALGAGPYVAGTADSLLTVSSSVVDVDGTDHTQLDFTIDQLDAGDTATITYRVQVQQGLGAGHYVGANVADLLDVGSLPDGTFTVAVGNLAVGNSVFDNTLERDTASTPSYDTQGPVGDDIGIQYPEFTPRIYRRYDLEGNLTDTLLTDFTTLRIGDILIYEQEVTLPRHTSLFDGGASGNALAFRNRLNRGYHYITDSEEFALGDIDLTALHKAGSPSTPFAVISNHEFPTWLFDDIANTSADSQTAILRFKAEVKTTEYNGAAFFTDQTASYNLLNQSYLFWNTADSVEKDTYQYWTSISAGDHPYLRRDSVVTGVMQPNLQLFKTAVPVADSFIGVSGGVGDTVTYTVTLRNCDSDLAGTYQGRNTAYNVLLTDVLPKDLAPIAPAEPLLTAAIYSLNASTGAITGLLRTLVRNSDYTYNYVFDTESQQGTISLETKRDGTDYDSRIDARNALVITYQVIVDPDIGAQGSGAGQHVNQAMVDNYYSFPENINDLSRKQYGPEGPKRVSLLTEIPIMDKTSPTADESVVPGAIVEYTLTAPKEMIRANLYEVEFRDTIPDGLSFGGDGSEVVVTGTGPGPVQLNIGDDVSGDEVVVTGGTGAVTITVTGRILVVAIERIDANAQVSVALRTVVKANFDNGNAISRLHEFMNTASLPWYDDDSTFADRSRYATMSPTVSHFFDARGILFEPSNTGTAQPGTIRTYRHKLRNFEDDAVSIPLVFSAIQSDWTWQLFVGDGEGNITTGPFESGYSVDVPADGVTEVIMRTFVPSEITSLTTDVLTITATASSDNIITVTDTTVVQAERIAVFKDISTTGDYGTRLEVSPDQENTINQRIRFYNNGSENVKEIYVYDFIPENTAYIANSAVNTAEFGLQYSKDGGVNWLTGEPADNGETVTSGSVPAVTNLRWYYDAGGILVPGVEKIITFQIRIQ